MVIGEKMVRAKATEKAPYKMYQTLSV